MKKVQITTDGIYTDIKMTMTEKKITLKELSKGYVNNDANEEGGVYSMNGKLNIRPKYQRSYIHEDDMVWITNLFNSIIHGFPINQFYFGVNKDGTWEVMDGQQRTIAICDYINGRCHALYIDGFTRTFSNLTDDLQNRILTYEVKVNLCEGSESEKLKWFNIINQENARLGQQELRNSVFIGPWLESAKKYFSVPSKKFAGREITDKKSRYFYKNYFRKSTLIERQECLENAIDWISYYVYANSPKKMTREQRIERYMSEHQNDENADEMINHYKKVIDWIWHMFMYGKKEGSRTANPMSNANWGKIFTEYENTTLDPEYCTKRAEKLISYESVTKKERVYDFILMGEGLENENILQPRSLTDGDKEALYIQQNGISPIDNKHYEFEEMETHHIIPVSRGGLTNLDNCILITKEQHQKLHCCEYNSDEVRTMKENLINKNN